MENETGLLDPELQHSPESAAELAKAETLLDAADTFYEQADEISGQVVDGRDLAARTEAEKRRNSLETEGNLRWNGIGELAQQNPDIIRQLSPTHPRSQMKLRQLLDQLG